MFNNIKGRILESELNGMAMFVMPTNYYKDSFNALLLDTAEAAYDEWMSEADEVGDEAICDWVIKGDEMASTSCGRYINIWATDGAYDCFIKFHEAENDDKVDEAIKATEDICHHIMKNKYMKTEEKRKLIDNLLDTYTEFGVGVIIVTDKAKERK